MASLEQKIISLELKLGKLNRKKQGLDKKGIGIAPAFRSHLPVVVPLQKLWDRARSWWYHLWLPSYPAQKIYDLYQGLRALDDITPMPIYHAVPVNVKALRALQRAGPEAVNYFLRASDHFRLFFYHKINTYLDNLAHDVKNKTVANLIAGKVKTEEGVRGVESIDEAKAREVLTRKLPGFNPAELQDILDDGILGAVDGAGEKTFASISKKMEDDYGETIPGLGRGYEANIWVNRLTNFYQKEYEAYVVPAIKLISSYLPGGAPFVYEAQKKKDPRKGARPHMPLELLAAIKGE